MIDEIYDSANKFTKALDDIVKEIKDESNQVVRKTLVDVTEKIKKDTPRDTGRAAAGWILTAESPSNYIPPEGKHELTSTNDPGYASNHTWYIVNNVEYISMLENGHSQQAPTGMVANALNSFGNILKNNAKGSNIIK